MKYSLLILLFNCFLHVYSQNNIFDLARTGSLDEVINVYENNPDVINYTNKEGYSPLILACYHGNDEVAKFLINKVEDINGSSDFGTPLMAAVVKGNRILVKLLLDKKADTNIADINGTTALHYAVLFKNSEIIKLLMKSNANINQKDHRNQSAMDYALLNKDKEIINLLNNQL